MSMKSANHRYRSPGNLGLTRSDRYMYNGRSIVHYLGSRDHWIDIAN